MDAIKTDSLKCVDSVHSVTKEFKNALDCLMRVGRPGSEKWVGLKSMESDLVKKLEEEIECLDEVYRSFQGYQRQFSTLRREIIKEVKENTIRALSPEQVLGYKEMCNDTVFSLYWRWVEFVDCWQSVLWSWFPEMYRMKDVTINSLKTPFTLESEVSTIISKLTAEYGERKSAVIYAVKWRVDSFINFLDFFTDSVAEVIARYLGTVVNTFEEVRQIYYNNAPSKIDKVERDLSDISAYPNLNNTQKVLLIRFLQEYDKFPKLNHSSPKIEYALIEALTGLNTGNILKGSEGAVAKADAIIKRKAFTYNRLPHKKKDLEVVREIIVELQLPQLIADIDQRIKEYNALLGID